MKEYRSREEIPAEAKWRLEDIYATDELWEADFSTLEAQIPELEALKETIASSADALAKGLDTIDKASLTLERLYVYARMHRDEDNGNAKYQALTDRAMTLNVKLATALSWFDPLLLTIDESKLLKWIDETPALAPHAFGIKELLRGKAHILPEREEMLLSMAGEFSGGARDIFTMLNNADLTFAPVCSGNEQLPLTHATYIVLLQNKDRAVREAAFRNYYASYKADLNTITATYATSVKKDVFYANARNYEGALQKALFADNVPVSLYDDLITDIHNSLPVLHRYMALRKKLLGLDELHMWDIFAPLVADADKKYTYDEAVKTTIDALAPLGEDYVSTLTGAFTQGWVDVYENPGKTSGAYSWGVYGTHPYVLLNHRDDLNSIFTIAHEMGHAMHTYYSNEAQQYATSGYTIFVAEVASTVNEILLTKHLLKTTTDEALKKYVLNHFIDQFRTTVIRQTMFAEFERISHTMAETGKPLTKETLCNEYGQLNAMYHGPAMAKDDCIDCEWARIPHFYNAFYVYKYATGFSCAASIVRNLDKPGNAAKYREFLRGGGSDHPMALLERAGIDFKTVVKDCMAEFDKALRDFEALTK